MWKWFNERHGFWTDEARADFVRAAEDAIEAYREYVDVVSSTRGWEDRGRVSEAVEANLRVFDDANRAQQRFCGTGGPWVGLSEHEQDDAAAQRGGALSLLERRDYRVDDSAALLEALRREMPSDEYPWGMDSGDDLGFVLAYFASDRGTLSVDALDGLSLSTAYLVTVRHDRPASGDDLDCARHEGVAFRVDGNEVGATWTSGDRPSRMPSWIRRRRSTS